MRLPNDNGHEVCEGEGNIYWREALFVEGFERDVSYIQIGTTNYVYEQCNVMKCAEGWVPGSDFDVYLKNEHCRLS